VAEELEAAEELDSVVELDSAELELEDPAAELDEAPPELSDAPELAAVELFVAAGPQAASESSEAAARMRRHLCLVMMRPLLCFLKFYEGNGGDESTVTDLLPIRGSRLEGPYVLTARSGF
jgi:hypothetical protein